MSSDKIILASFNQILGTASKNVPAYSNTDDEAFNVGRHYLHGIFMGVKWQCVEYARRWLLLRKGCVFKNIRCAADIWSDLTYVERVTDGKQFPLKTHPNGSSTFPTIDSFLIYCRSEEQPVGHIAVICDVGPDYIRIAEQNNEFHYWKGEYARQIPVIFKDGLYYVEDEDPSYGWMEIDDNNQLKTLEELGIDAIHPQYVQPPPTGKFNRSTTIKNPDLTKTDWLDKENSAENYFIQRYGKDPQEINNHSAELVYYKINFDFLLNVGETSGELHRIFLEATNRVINDDELLTRFDIPSIFWKKIRQSWINEQNQTIIGRLDLAFDGQKLKVLEYNADTSIGLFECAVIQKKWFEAVGLSSHFTPVRRLHMALVHNWKKMKMNSRVHLFIDDDNNEDEMLTALYMQNIIQEAGLESKLCIGTKELHWKDGIIIDNDGQTVRIAWKLWMWDTIFQDYLSGNKDHQIDSSNSIKHPRISEIFLHDQIQVIEPLWKVITSNKGLLPLLYQMYPNHPHLLPCEWNLTEQIKENSFVKKPLVGRYSQNITIYDSKDDSVIATTTGQFSDRKTIYQELFPRKSINGNYPIITSWIIGGLWAGFGVREDENLITNDKSPLTPCCIIWEDEK